MMRADIFLAMKYERLVMSLDEVCHEIGAEFGTVRNEMSAGTFPIPTRKEGKHVVADVRDVGRFLDEQRDQASRLIASKSRAAPSRGVSANRPRDSVEWVKLERYLELTGDTADAVHARRKLGKWLDGQQCKIVDGRLWVNLPAVETWVVNWSDTT